MITQLAAAVVCALVWGCASAPPPDAAAPRANALPDFSVLTYNVNFAAPRPELAVRAIKEADADVVCLQETTPEWERAVREGLGETYPYIRFRTEPGAAGMALLSKWELERITFRRTDAGWFPACIATVNTPAGTVRVVSVHLRPPVSDNGSFASGYFTTPPVRRNEIQEIHEAATDPAVPLVFVGDFNESRGGGAVRYLSTQGYRSALRQHSPQASTWHWQYGMIPLSGQLDHVLHDASLECLDARVLRRGASDHYPVLATFRFRDGRAARPAGSDPHMSEDLKAPTIGENRK
jgi:endonuclease/exonuclease/phosphatase (EEP) superfamily protein YafD